MTKVRRAALPGSGTLVRTTGEPTLRMPLMPDLLSPSSCQLAVKTRLMLRNFGRTAAMVMLPAVSAAVISTRAAPISKAVPSGISRPVFWIVAARGRMKLAAELRGEPEGLRLVALLPRSKSPSPSRSWTRPRVEGLAAKAEERLTGARKSALIPPP